MKNCFLTFVPMEQCYNLGSYLELIWSCKFKRSFGEHFESVAKSFILGEDLIVQQNNLCTDCFDVGHRLNESR